MIWVGLGLAYLAAGFLVTMVMGMIWTDLDKGGPTPPLIMAFWPIVCLSGVFFLTIGGLSYLAVECGEWIRWKVEK
jgi:hypothetical protein